MDEKRRYFRIHDSIGLALRKARAHKANLKLSDSETGYDQELRNVESELNSLVNALWGVDPKVAKAIGLLNRKIEILALKKVATDSRDVDNFDFRYESLPVSLSASGIAFTNKEPLAVNDRLEMMLILKPVNSRIVVKGTVVESQQRNESETGGHRIRVEFDLTAVEEEQLIQHIVQRQVQLIAKDDTV